MSGYFTSAKILFDTVVLTNYYQTYLDFSSSTADAFLTKFDSSGNGIWAVDIGGIGSENANSVAIDSKGNVVICGSYNSDTVYFGSYYITNNGIDNIFVASFNPSGNLLWYDHAGGKLNDIANSITVDTANNVFIAGSFTSPY